MPSPCVAIRYVDRASGQQRDEIVLDVGLVRFVYGSRVGLALRTAILTRPFFNQVYGRFQSSAWSKPSIERVTRRLAIDMSDYVVPPGGFAHFNAFFARSLRPGARPMEGDPSRLVSPADGRLFAYTEVTGDTLLPAKGRAISLRELLADDVEARRFTDGTVLVVRLSPGDYHRFHFPCDGDASAPRSIAGPLESVDPIALASGCAILDRNRRDVTLFETERFGHVAYLEIGAMCVGSIVHSFAPGRARAGDEKGFFQFGGSTVIDVLERGCITIDPDLVAHTRRGLETFVRMGEGVGTAVSPHA